MTETLTKLRENSEVLHGQTESRENVDLMIESGDYKAVVKTEEFGRLSEHGKIELVQRAVTNKIELSNERFFRLIGDGDSESAVCCDDQIGSLLTLQHAIDVYAVQLEMQKSNGDFSDGNDGSVVSIVESFSAEKQVLPEVV